MKFHSALFKPGENYICFDVAGLHRFVKQRGLAQALFKHSTIMKDTIRNNCVEHSHATFIENAENCFLPSKFCGQCFAKLRRFGRNSKFVERTNMRKVMSNFSRLQPLAKFRE